jgi:predicted O-linked N-acetylglucosamine transferase (SPINDLY family)
VAVLFSRPFLPLSSPCPIPPLPPPPIEIEASSPLAPGTGSPKLAASSLKIGYLCYDFNDHPTAHLIEGLFHHHTSPPLALSYGKDDNSTYRRSIERLTRPSHRFLELAPLGYTQAATAIRQAAPHIVVDLQGHTLGTRTEIIAQRVAPIQVNYLIYPGTSGAGFIDHVIADRYALPPDRLANGYTEKVVYMPHSYQVRTKNKTLASNGCSHLYRLLHSKAF